MATGRTVDIPSEVFDEAGRNTNNYTVGFVKLTGPGSVDTGFCASGTLVTVDGYHAVLTAAHVVNSLERTTKFGVVLPGFPSGQLHKIIFEKNLMRSIKIPRTTDLTECDPPDIALIMLPDARWSDIAARKSFCNISKRQRELLAHHPEQRSGFWTISGFAQEWVSTDLRDNGSKRVIELNGMVLTGTVTPIQTKAEFDGWAFTVQDGGEYDGPRNFGGYSGGGLWQNLIKEEDGQIRLVESTLLGVAYHQSGFERNLNTIRCNGRRCIYEHIVQVAKAAR